MASPITCIVLAAGKGTRMRSKTHKVLHEVAGRSLLGHVLASTSEIGAAQVIVVVGAGRAQVEASLAGQTHITTAYQAEQLGTGHAVLCAKSAVADMNGVAIVLYGDVPFVSADTLKSLETKARENGGVAVLGFEAADPGAYGRLVRGDGDALKAIVEFKDATAQEQAITLCNSGILAAPTQVLFDLLSKVTDHNAAGEYYLTDIVELARQDGLAASVTVADEAQVQGVNSRQDLSAAEASFQARKRGDMMASGVTLQAADSVYFNVDTVVDQDVVIEPNVVFGSGVHVKEGATIRAFSHLEGCVVEGGAVVGPYARLRPGAHIGEGVKIGNFVEVKNATFEAGAKANHLSYIGDAHVGANANIGAGTITCNYDGFFKHRTTIGDGAFIGSNSALVAPVSIGANAIVGAGSAITKDVGPGALSFTRAPQSSKEHWATKFQSIMAAKKAARTK